MIETRSIEEIESDYDVEMSNDVLAQYHGGMGSGVYSVVSRWMGHCTVGHGDVQVHRAVQEMDEYIAWARKRLADPTIPTDKEINLPEARAYRALLAAHWNEQFTKGGTRGDDLGPIEALEG